MPWFLIPIYAVITMRQMSGSLKTRFQYLGRSKDWHPIGEVHRQLYYETKGPTNVAYQLNQINNTNE